MNKKQRTFSPQEKARVALALKEEKIKYKILEIQVFRSGLCSRYFI